MLGVLPSVVYRIDAPLVVVLMVTLCAEVYVAAPGLIVGVATGVLFAVPPVRNNPEMTAFTGPLLVTCRITWPLTFHTTHSPLLKFVTLRLSNTA